MVAARDVMAARAAGEWTRPLATLQWGISWFGSLIADGSAGRRQCVPVGNGVRDDSARQGEGDAHDQQDASEDSE